MTPVADRICRLQLAAGRHERCPEQRCPFWDESACVIDGVRPDIETTPELAAYLLDIRARLARTHGWSPFRLLGRGGSVAGGAQADTAPPPPDHSL
jgi:hypothetical protein